MYYFVNKELGIDEQAGGFDMPFKTAQRAVDIALPGDTIYLRQGVYLEQVIFPRSGEKKAFIKLAGYPGELPVLDGHQLDISGGDGLLRVHNIDYVDISRLRLINSTFGGADIRNATNIQVNEIKTYNTGGGGIVVVNASHIKLGHNEVERACIGGDDEFIILGNVHRFEVFSNHIHNAKPGAPVAVGLNILDGCQRGKVYNNHIHNIGHTGLYIDAWDQLNWNIEVYENSIHDTLRSGIALGSERGGWNRRINVFNNSIYSNGFSGIWIPYWRPDISHPMRYINIYTNRIFNNGWEREGHCGGILHENPDATKVKIYQNFVSQNHDFQIALRNGAKAETPDNEIDGFRGAEGEIQ